MNVLLPVMASALAMLVVHLLYQAATRRVIVLPDVFYMLTRRQALMLPLFDEPDAHIEHAEGRFLKLSVSGPLPATITVTTRTEWDGEHFMFEIESRALCALDEEVSIHAGMLGSDSSGDESLPSIPALHLRRQVKGQPACELRASWHALCGLLGGAVTPHTPGALSPFAAGALSRSPHVLARLTGVIARGDRLKLCYEGVMREDVSAPPAARRATQHMLAHYRAHGVALASWKEDPLHELALDALGAEVCAPEVRRLAAQVLLEFYDVSGVDAHALRGRMERAVRAHWVDHDLDELLPKMRARFFDECDTPLLIDMAEHSADVRLRDTIKARTSRVELITDERISPKMRRDELIAAMHLKRAFLRAGEEIVEGVDVRRSGWVLEVFIFHGWEELWGQPWLEQSVTQWFMALDALAHARLQDQLEQALATTPDARGAQQLFDRIYTSWVEERLFALVRRIPVSVLTRVLALRADFEQDALAWTLLFDVLEEDHIRALFAHASLKEAQRLELLARIMRTARTRTMSDRQGLLRIRLIGAFEIASVAASSVPDAHFDEVANALLHYDAGVFADAEASKRLRYGIRAYARQIERQGVRKGAMTTIRAIAQSLPAAKKSWVEPIIERWTEQMGSDTMSGALTWRDEDARVGALSVERDED